MSAPLDHPLREPSFLAFPLRAGAQGLARSGRVAHVRELIEQLLFTAPGERVMRPEFGVGARSLVFEPAGSALRELATKRVRSGLAELLEGEVDPSTLDVTLAVEETRLVIQISYALATVGRREEHVFALGRTDG
jgi:hypothetical protein